MYKYNILERLDRLSGNDRIIFWQWAPEQLFRNKETIRGWLYIPEKSSKEIGIPALLKLAVFFQCKVEDLFTNELDRNAVVESIQNHSNHVHRRD
nr:hypothetical protein [uncultured Fluviicola sp.]